MMKMTQTKMKKIMKMTKTTTTTKKITMLETPGSRWKTHREHRRRMSSLIWQGFAGDRVSKRPRGFWPRKYEPLPEKCTCQEVTISGERKQFRERKKNLKSSVIWMEDEVSYMIMNEDLQYDVIEKYSYGLPNLSKLRKILLTQCESKSECIIRYLSNRYILVSIYYEGLYIF